MDFDFATLGLSSSEPCEENRHEHEPGVEDFIFIARACLFIYLFALADQKSVDMLIIIAQLLSSNKKPECHRP